MSGIEGQTYVVTGASKGIGRAICLELAKAGAIVALLARQSDELNQATQEVQSISPQSFAVACDLANPAMVTGAATEILSMAPQLDGLVHNAGDILEDRRRLLLRAVDAGQADCLLLLLRFARPEQEI